MEFFQGSRHPKEESKASPSKANENKEQHPQRYTNDHVDKGIVAISIVTEERQMQTSTPAISSPPSQSKDRGDTFDWKRVRDILWRDRSLILAAILLVSLMNTNIGRRYILYPFVIFSTWVHEVCHGVAALLMGGSIGKLQIFGDGGGLAFTSVPGNSNFRGGFVSSGGYPGTAVTGCLLLLVRRTTHGPSMGTLGMGVALLLSCALWVRNTFGLLVLSGEGVVLILLALFLPPSWVQHVYNFLALTICLNAVSSIHRLFGSSEGSGSVNGQSMQSDAHTVAEKWDIGLSYQHWACIWLVMSLVATLVGIVCAVPGEHDDDACPDLPTLPIRTTTTTRATNINSQTQPNNRLWSLVNNGFAKKAATTSPSNPDSAQATAQQVMAQRPQFLAYTV